MPGQVLTRFGLVAGLLGAAALIMVSSGAARPDDGSDQQSDAASEPQHAHDSHQHGTAKLPGELKPVESDPHEFMEYINRPAYQRLKQAMSSKPEQEEGWQSITSDALLLAEVGNLLLMRAPEVNSDVWSKHAIALRESGSAMYEASGDQNYSAARQSWKNMISHCNACHDDFHRGRPNLEP